MQQIRCKCRIWWKSSIPIDAVKNSAWRTNVFLLHHHHLDFVRNIKETKRSESTRQQIKCAVNYSSSILLLVAIRKLIFGHTPIIFRRESKIEFWSISNGDSIIIVLVGQNPFCLIVLAVFLFFNPFFSSPLLDIPYKIQPSQCI